MSTRPTDAASRPHLLHVFSTFAVGGPQVRFATLANRFGDRYRHTMIAMDGRYDCSSQLDPALDVRLTPLPVSKGGGLSLANLRRFRATVRELKPDLLLTYNWGTIEWALAQRLRPFCPHLHFEDGFGPDEADGRQLPRRVWLRRVALSGGSRVVVPSRLLHWIATEQWRLAPRRLHFIPNGVDTARFASASAADLPGIPADALVIGSVGALRPEKNYARLLRAVASLAGDHFVVLVGDGSERRALEELARSLGIAERVHFAGRVDAPEALLARFDIFALSSDTEQMPISLIEAMAAGRPVVATDVGDIRDMVAPDNRPLVVATADEQAFARALQTLLTDADQRRRLGQANAERAKADYDLSIMEAAYRVLFDRA
jgi:glycosyltransferase involved in cell wall biosynthesis